MVERRDMAGSGGGDRRMDRVLNVRIAYELKPSRDSESSVEDEMWMNSEEWTESMLDGMLDRVSTEYRFQARAHPKSRSAVIAPNTD
jgi:hypothetical protein